MTTEIWKNIEGYEGLYQVSSLGRIMNSKLLIMKSQIQNSGYLIVHLSKNDKRKAFTIHRLVAKAFIPLVDSKHFVNHKDGNKLNNYCENLEWCTESENMVHSFANGLHVSYVRTEDHRKNLSIVCSSTHKGVKKSSEHNLKNKLSHIGITPKSTLNRTRKDFVKVLCVETGVIYPTIKDAADSIPCPKDKLWRHLRYGTKYDFITKTFKIIKDGSFGGKRI